MLHSSLIQYKATTPSNSFLSCHLFDAFKKVMYVYMNMFVCVSPAF